MIEEIKESRGSGSITTIMTAEDIIDGYELKLIEKEDRIGREDFIELLKE